MGRILVVLLVVGCSYAPRRLGEVDGPANDDAGVVGDVPVDDAPADVAFSCPNGYTLRASGSCYRVVMNAVTWDSAEADCEIAGAHLAVVDDLAEDADVPDNVWIGVSERVTPGTFRWVTGVPLLFTGWATGEPGGVGGASCVEARADGWHDDNCPEAKPYACEYDGRSADPSQF